MKTIEIPVLIVGGGPVGLYISILLSHHGVPSLLVERHTGTSLCPKARAGEHAHNGDLPRVWPGAGST